MSLSFKFEQPNKRQGCMKYTRERYNKTSTAKISGENI